MLYAIPLLIAAGATVSILVSRMVSRGQNAYAEVATVVEQTIGSIGIVCYIARLKECYLIFGKIMIFL